MIDHVNTTIRTRRIRLTVLEHAFTSSVTGHIILCRPNLMDICEQFLKL